MALDCGFSWSLMRPHSWLRDLELVVNATMQCIIFVIAIVAFFFLHVQELFFTASASLQNWEAAGFSPPVTLYFLCVVHRGALQFHRNEPDCSRHKSFTSIGLIFPPFSSPRCSGVTRLGGVFSSWLLLFQVKMIPDIFLKYLLQYFYFSPW